MLYTSEQNNNDDRKFYYENIASKKTMKHLQTPERRTKILYSTKQTPKNIIIV